ncbi:unnamed protein product [Boreogadus saida]
MQSDLFYLPVNNSGKQQLDSRAQRPVLGDRTNGVVNGCVDTVGDIVKQRLPGASRLSTKIPSRGLALPDSPLAAALNPDSPMQVRRVSAIPQHVIETGAPPTESVIVQPDGAIKHEHKLYFPHLSTRK